MKVFLDMDGVLVDFVGGIYRAFGVPYDYGISATKWKFYADMGLSFEEFDSICNIDFWARLDWMRDGRAILNTIIDKIQPIASIYLVTAPMPNPGSSTGKTLWVKKHISWLKERLIITQASKALMAGPDTLLIDDKDQNVIEFQKAGGQAILVPRPWNSEYVHARDTLDVVQKAIRSL